MVCVFVMWIIGPLWKSSFNLSGLFYLNKMKTSHQDTAALLDYTQRQKRPTPLDNVNLIRETIRGETKGGICVCIAGL